MKIQTFTKAYIINLKKRQKEKKMQCTTNYPKLKKERKKKTQIISPISLRQNLYKQSQQ